MDILTQTYSILKIFGFIDVEMHPSSIPLRIRIIIEDETEHKSEGNEKRDIGENDVEVGAQDFGEHLNVMRNFGFWDNPHEIQVKLNKLIRQTFS